MLKQRLAFYKSKVGVHGIKDWREVANCHHYWSKSLARAVITGGNGDMWGDSQKWFSDDDLRGLRFVGHADELVRLDHTGHYVDETFSSAVRGAVWRLTGKNKGERMISGCIIKDEFGGNESHAFISYEVFADEMLAARNADRLAEKYAADSRECYAKDQAEQDIENARDEIHTINRNALGLIAEIKHAGQFSPAVCDAIKSHLKSLIDERRKQFDIISKRRENPWTAVHG